MLSTMFGERHGGDLLLLMRIIFFNINDSKNILFFFRYFNIKMYNNNFKIKIN